MDELDRCILRCQRARLSTPSPVTTRFYSLCEWHNKLCLMDLEGCPNAREEQKEEQEVEVGLRCANCKEPLDPNDPDTVPVFGGAEICLPCWEEMCLP